MADRDYSALSKHFFMRSGRYDKHDTWVNNPSILSQIVSFLPKSATHTLEIVDLGAGTGAVSRYIAENYPYNNHIHAVDLSEEMLSRITNPSIQKHIANVEALPFCDHQFDAGVSRQCLHYVINLNNASSEIKRVIKPGGSFILAQIVPLDTEQKDYWQQIIHFRQPLRKHFFTEREWIAHFVSRGFSLQASAHFSHTGSVNNWAIKYSITEKEKIEGYKQLLLCANSAFKSEYNVIETDDDVLYSTYWFVAFFSL